MGIDAVDYFRRSVAAGAGVLTTLVQARQASRLRYERLQPLGDSIGLAGTWDTLGAAHHGAGSPAAAVDHYKQAINMYRANGDRYGEANTLDRLGDAYQAADDPPAARHAWKQAIDVLTDLDDPAAAKTRAKLAASGRLNDGRS